VDQISKDILRKDTLLSCLVPDSVNSLMGIAVIKNASEGQVIHRKGDEPAGLIRVLNGRIRAGATDIAGTEFLLTTIAPGDWFGEISILDGKPRTHDAVALDDCVYALFPTMALRRMSIEHPDIHELMVQMLCAHIRGAFSALDDFLLISPERRLAKRVIEMHSKQNGEATIKMSQQDLSDLIGLSRQSINKILKSWEHKGLIARIYRGFDIVSVDGLHDLASNESALY